MRRKSTRHIYLTWLMLLGMLFHVLVEHQDGSTDLFLSQQPDGQIVMENALRHTETHHVTHDDDHNDDDHPHEHLDVDHPESYVCASSTDAHDLLSLRLVSLLVSLPQWSELPQLQLELASVWENPEPQPPPEQIKLALTTTILLI